MTQEGLQTIQTSKADRFNELVGLEIESKLKIVGQCPINEVAEVIFRTLQNSVGQYGVAPSLPIIRLSKTVVRHYGYQNQKGMIRKAFTVTERDRDGLLQIKRKGPKALYHQNVLSKTEHVESLSWAHWTAEAELATIHREANSLDDKVDPKCIFLVAGTVERQKLKIRVINNNNNRVYTIGVDETTVPNGKTMRQIEIEYVGIEPSAFPFGQETQAKADNLIEMEIVTEIKIIEQMVISACSQVNIALKPTRKTKFKWLRGMCNTDVDCLKIKSL